MVPTGNFQPCLLGSSPSAANSNCTQVAIVPSGPLKEFEEASYSSLLSNSDIIRNEVNHECTTLCKQSQNFGYGVSIYTHGFFNDVISRSKRIDELFSDEQKSPGFEKLVVFRQLVEIYKVQSPIEIGGHRFGMYTHLSTDHEKPGQMEKIKTQHKDLLKDINEELANLDENHRRYLLHALTIDDQKMSNAETSYGAADVIDLASYCPAHYVWVQVLFTFKRGCLNDGLSELPEINKFKPPGAKYHTPESREASERMPPLSLSFGQFKLGTVSEQKVKPFHID